MLRRVDLHVHTRFSEWKHLRIIKPRDSYNDPLQVYARCRAAGMDFMAITDHDTIDGAVDLLSRRPDLEPQVIIGEEVETVFPDTGQWIHVNVFGIDEAIHDDLARLKGNVRELVGYLRRNGIFHVLNHPFQSYRIQKPAMAFVEDILELFDHFEVGNCTISSRQNQAVAEMLDYATALHTKKIGVGGSDAHNLRNIGVYATEVDLPDGVASDKNAWLAAVAEGRGRAVGRTIGALGLTANVYQIIGQYYLSLGDREVRRHMRAENYLAAAVLAPACLAGLPAIINAGNSLKSETIALYLRRSLRTTRRREVLASDFIEELPD